MTSLVPLANYVIGGDFNVYHDFFTPRVSNFSRGGELVEWSTNNMIDFIREAGVLT